MFSKNFVQDLKYDIPASIVVFLVAIPLCLGIALVSGAPLFSGIIAGMVGGIIVTAASKSPLGVSGPAAGLAVIVLASIQQLGAFEIFLVAVVLAGIIQLVLGFIKAGVIAYYFPSSVIKGMLSGIGLIIILKQIPHAVGYDADPEGDFSFFQADGHTTFSELFYMMDNISMGAVWITLISMAILILWEQGFMKKHKIFTWIQGPLVAVAAGIGLNVAFKGNESLALTGDQVVNIPVAGSLSGFFGQFTFPDLSHVFDPEVIVVAITIAVVASLETLLCVEATDKLDPQRRITPTNRELKAQGLGNIISGFIGGLPITQVIVRSSANIQSGGRSRTSAFLHGVLLLVCAIAIPGVLNMVPLASLAAILFIVGYKLAKPVVFKNMFEAGKAQFIPFMVTILGIIFTDLLVGIGLGLVVAIFYILYNNYRIPYHVETEGNQVGGPVRLRLAEVVSFLNKASIMHTLKKLPDGTHIIIDASMTKRIHPDIIEIIEDFRENALTRDIEVSFEGLVEERPLHDPVAHFGHLVLNEKPPKQNRMEKFLFN